MTDQLAQSLGDVDKAPLLTGGEAAPTQDASVRLNRQSVPGEYLTMFLVAHAGFVAVAWGCFSENWFCRIGMTVAATWVVARLVGVLSKWWVTPAISLTMIALAIKIGGVVPQGTPDWLVDGPFSSITLLVSLGLVLILDMQELAEARGQQFAGFLRRNGIAILAVGVVGFMLIHSIVVPLIRELIYRQNAPEPTEFTMDRLTLHQSMVFNFVEASTGLFFLAVGMSVGSFLNVVIYRVPRGLSLVTEHSHCPECNEQISGVDLLPLIGWLRLEGRCRNCDAAISARYPSIEIVIGLVFLLLFFVELISGGTNLPVRHPNYYAGVQWILFYPKWDLISLYIFQVLPDFAYVATQQVHNASRGC